MSDIRYQVEFAGGVVSASSHRAKAAREEAMRLAKQTGRRHAVARFDAEGDHYERFGEAVPGRTGRVRWVPA